MTRAEHLQAIKDADRAYYEQDSPTMSDAAYDELRRDYIAQYGAADLDYTPGAVSAGFRPFHHPLPVTSLAKIKDGEQDKLQQWLTKLAPIVLEPKLDGLTVVAYPQADGTYQFVTRGSGTEGEILPNFIHRYEGRFGAEAQSAWAIRGEVLLTQAAFEQIKADQIARGEEPFKQIRNAAAGILRNKERSPYIDQLTYICYDVLGWDVGEREKLQYIAEHTPFQANVCSELFAADSAVTTVQQAIEATYAQGQAQWPCDGVVIKTLQEGSLAAYGGTDHHPNNAVAWKPAKQLFATTLRDIEFSVGRTKITPVAIFDPVIIDDTEVTRASIHNKDYFDEMALCEGDTVYVYKSNEIIPQIDSVVHNGGEPFVWPEAADTATDVVIRNIMHLVSKPVLNIKGFSRATAAKICAAYPERVQEQQEYVIFTLSEAEFAALPGFAAKSAANLYAQIAARRQDGVEAGRYFRALCLPGIGAHVGEALAGHFSDVQAFKGFLAAEDVSTEEKQAQLQDIAGIGPETATVLTSAAFTQAEARLQSYLPVQWSQPEPAAAPADSAVAGKNFVLTGKMPEPRSYYEAKIQAAGGNVQSGVNSKTDYLVIADTSSTSSKAQKARQLGTTLVAPEELLALLEKSVL